MQHVLGASSRRQRLPHLCRPGTQAGRAARGQTARDGAACPCRPRCACQRPSACCVLGAPEEAAWPENRQLHVLAPRRLAPRPTFKPLGHLVRQRSAGRIRRPPPAVAVKHAEERGGIATQRRLRAVQRALSAGHVLHSRDAGRRIRREEAAASTQRITQRKPASLCGGPRCPLPCHEPSAVSPERRLAAPFGHEAPSPPPTCLACLPLALVVPPGARHNTALEAQLVRGGSHCGLLAGGVRDLQGGRVPRQWMTAHRSACTTVARHAAQRRVLPPPPRSGMHAPAAAHLWREEGGEGGDTVLWHRQTARHGADCGREGRGAGACRRSVLQLD